MSEVLHRTVKELHDIAAERGLIVIIPEDNELQLDLDVPSYEHNHAIIKCLKDNGVNLVSWFRTISVNGKRHTYLRLDRDFSRQERIALQACLGSDPVREVLSLLRGEAWDVPIALFETPMWAKKVEEWRAR